MMKPTRSEFAILVMTVAEVVNNIRTVNNFSKPIMKRSIIFGIRYWTAIQFALSGSESNARSVRTFHEVRNG